MIPAGLLGSGLGSAQHAFREIHAMDFGHPGIKRQHSSGSAAHLHQTLGAQAPYLLIDESNAKGAQQQLTGNAEGFEAQVGKSTFVPVFFWVVAHDGSGVSKRGLARVSINQ